MLDALSPGVALARPVRYRGGPLHGRSSDLAIEELVLAYERLEVAAA